MKTLSVEREALDDDKNGANQNGSTLNDQPSTSLQTGDILLFGGRGFFSWIIRVATSLAMPVAVFSGIGVALLVYALVRDIFAVPAAFAVGGCVFLSVLAIVGPSPYSHVGFICARGGELLLWESTTLSDLECKLCGKATKGLQCVDPFERIQGYDGHVWMMQPRRPWESHETARALGWLTYRDGTRYDVLGAISAGRIGRFVWGQERLKRLFCSETLIALLIEVGRVSRRYNPSSWNPTDVAELLEEFEIYLPPKKLK